MEWPNSLGSKRRGKANSSLRAVGARRYLQHYLRVTVQFTDNASGSRVGRFDRTDLSACSRVRHDRWFMAAVQQCGAEEDRFDTDTGFLSGIVQLCRARLGRHRRRPRAHMEVDH